MKTFIYTLLIQLIGYIILIVLYPTLTTIFLLIFSFDINIILFLMFDEVQIKLKELDKDNE